MLVFPQWRPDVSGRECRAPRWIPVERFAPYFARPVPLPPPPQVDDEESSGGSSPERERERECVGECGEGEVRQCSWRGCGAVFASVARLSAHIARSHAHAHADGLFYCGWQGCVRPQRGFNARYKMLVHVRTHTNERPHTCNQCNKSFSRAENLKIHLRSHSGEKPYVCPYEGCGKAYSNSSDRFKHTRTHTVDKPYCCKVPGCNKRYTDPSSLRKHVKTYKHFTPKETPRHESLDNLQSPDSFSPLRENGSSYRSIERNSPIHRQLTYSPTRCTISPTIPPYNPVINLTESSIPTTIAYPSVVDQVTYIRSLEHVYPLRVPTHEMSYLEYTQMYEQAYRTYYSSNISYPVLRPAISDKMFSYEKQPQIDVTMEKEKDFDRQERYGPVEDMPLNLKCAKQLDCKPIENLVRRSDLPLDLSTKS